VATTSVATTDIATARAPTTSATRSPFLTDFDLYLWGEGKHYRAYEKLGAHLTEQDGLAGTHFAVWAPNAREVSVIGDFNSWEPGAFYLHQRATSGIWEGFVPGVGQGALYKFAIESHHQGYRVVKADPYAFAAEMRPNTASRVWDLGGHAWGDADWMARRGRAHTVDAPIAIYEVHLGSWMRVPNEGNRWLSYRELADKLATYVHDLGYTHVELLPVSEHPLDMSWGYQTTGYFAPTSRFGTPQDFMFFVDALHRRGIGVILDWVPAHFPRDEFALGYFDGTHLYEHDDPRLGAHQDWGTFIFNYGRTEIGNFLISNALFWLDKYHIDGLRVDAVASMLYLDYSRKEGEWIPNRYGGRENIDAIDFLRRFNERVYGDYPDVLTLAEESTAWGGVSRPTYTGGLGFGYKWDMGWMHDTLHYLQHEPIHRKYHHNELTFRMLYAFTENYVLPLSHDEVVHGKGALLSRMPGNLEEKFANLRLLYGYMYSQPGKKLLFMGGELGQWDEWNSDSSIDWHLLEWPIHQGLQQLVRDLNAVYRREPALHERDCDPAGFEWIDANDYEHSIITFARNGRDPRDQIVVALNFTPVPRMNYHIGVSHGGRWDEILNSDADCYGGSGVGNCGGTDAAAIPWHGRPCVLNVTLPPLGVVMFKRRA
jgi:1,4-alpha-glucan branching enzyme